MDVIATTDGLAGGDALKALGVTVVEATLDEPGSILAGIKAEALHAVLWVDPFGKEDIKSGKTIGAALDRFEAVQHALSPLLRKSGRAGSFVVVEAVPDDEAAEDAGGINWASVGRDVIRSLLRQAASAADRGGVGYGLICIDRDTTQAPERVASARRVARALERTPNQWNGRAYSEDGDPSAL